MKKSETMQLCILKTLIEHPSLIDNVLSVMDIDMFGPYAGLFTALINGEHAHPGLVGLSIDENVKVMDERELNSALIKILTIHYRNKLQGIPRDTSIPSDKKAFLLKKIKLDILPRLKKGELVAFDSLK